MSGDPAWVIPAITASASLFGAIVGGFATYWTAKKAHERETAAEEFRQRYTLLRQAATRFVDTMTDSSLTTSGLERLAEQWGPLVDKLAAARTEAELVEVARVIDPTIEPGEGQLAILLQLVRESGVFDDDIRSRFSLLTELRLVAPRDVADCAQRVLYSAFAQDLTSAVAPRLQRQAVDSFNHEINDFVNRVRHYMNVEDIEFSFINEKLLHKVLEP